MSMEQAEMEQPEVPAGSGEGEVTPELKTVVRVDSREETAGVEEVNLTAATEEE